MCYYGDDGKLLLKQKKTKNDLLEIAFYSSDDMPQLLNSTLLRVPDGKKGENGMAKADALLKLYNRKTRGLKLTGVLGDNRVRAGSMIAVNLNLGDMKVRNFMLVESCRHTYREGEHWMDLTLRGGEFVG